MKVEEQDEIENPDLFDGSLDALRRSINRHEQSGSGAQYFKQKGSTLEIEEKMIEIKVGTVKPENQADALANVGLPAMDSFEGNKKKTAK
eukprot:CAMPEP_0185594346 /NCGR_PEP_ID=MMETSP0434-20130131/74514_1 /TAXON_ID=626734 ORGANISM="Favella taraikaensis, Strain Fe Narragansett Bay" /NCGR_SAMPLE_ID=MMETSP0434 /ASSEMBLY_ACC=CAM_ASM_000379 /LENGTH=89 /DNA_ID=CAMNT_0028221595 /DNA_START=375 /DNA_END=644 /DNA_ORIENTATION=+